MFDVADDIQTTLLLESIKGSIIEDIEAECFSCKSGKLMLDYDVLLKIIEKAFDVEYRKIDQAPEEIL